MKNYNLTAIKQLVLTWLLVASETISDFIAKYYNKYVIGHYHAWKQIKVYTNENHTYSHEIYECEDCDKLLHIKRYWNLSPTIKLTKINKIVS
jgi:hypothetical protein